MQKGLNIDSTSWFKNGQLSYIDTVLYFSTVEASDFRNIKSFEMYHYLYREWYENGVMKTEHFDHEYHKEWYDTGQLKRISLRNKPVTTNGISSHFSVREWYENGKLKRLSLTDDPENEICFDKYGNTINCEKYMDLY